MRHFKLRDYIAVVSDFDDTILDNQPIGGNGLHDRARLDALRVVGERHSLPALQAITAETNAVAFLHTPVYSIEGAFWWLLAQAGVVDAASQFDAHHPLVRELTDVKSVAYRHLLADGAREVPGARAFFGKLHTTGFSDKLAIASAACKEDILTFLEAHNLAGCFPANHIISRDDVVHPKPHPEAFEKAVLSMGIALDQGPRILVFEDDPRGIAAAKELGLTVCAVATTFTKEYLLDQRVRPDMVAADFNEYGRLFKL